MTRLASFQGTLNETDSKRHLEFTFTCPLGVVGLELTRPNYPEPVTGDVVNSTTTLSLHYEGVPADAFLRLVANGKVERELSLADSGRLELSLPDAARWCVLELRTPDGTMLAVTNPVFTAAFATSI